MARPASGGDTRRERAANGSTNQVPGCPSRLRGSGRNLCLEPVGETVDGGALAVLDLINFFLDLIRIARIGESPQRLLDIIVCLLGVGLALENLETVLGVPCEAWVLCYLSLVIASPYQETDL